MGTIAQGASQEVLEGILRASADVERASVARMVAEHLGALESETSHALGAAALELSRLAAKLAQDLGYAETVLSNDGVESAVLTSAVAEPDTALNGAPRPDNTEQIVVEISPAPEPVLGALNGSTNGSSPAAEAQPVAAQAVEPPPTTELGLEPVVEPVRVAPVSPELILHQPEEQKVNPTINGATLTEKDDAEIEVTPPNDTAAEKLVDQHIDGREIIRLNPDKLKSFLESRKPTYSFDKTTKLIIPKNQTFFVNGVEQALRLPKDGSSNAVIEALNGVLYAVIEADMRGITINQLAKLIKDEGGVPAELATYYQAFRRLERTGLVIKKSSGAQGTIFGLPKCMEIEDERILEEAGQPDFLVRH